jgi:hypothetical protein
LAFHLRKVADSSCSLFAESAKTSRSGRRIVGSGSFSSGYLDLWRPLEASNISLTHQISSMHIVDFTKTPSVCVYIYGKMHVKEIIIIWAIDWLKEQTTFGQPIFSGVGDSPSFVICVLAGFQ